LDAGGRERVVRATVLVAWLLGIVFILGPGRPPFSLVGVVAGARSSSPARSSPATGEAPWWRSTRVTSDAATAGITDGSVRS
jgi:hypothetical protein